MEFRRVESIWVETNLIEKNSTFFIELVQLK